MQSAASEGTILLRVEASDDRTRFAWQFICLVPNEADHGSLRTSSSP